VAEGGEHLERGLDQGPQVWSEAPCVYLPESLIEEIADPAELADDRVVRAGYG
jgi:hypothetical protein